MISIFKKNDVINVLLLLPYAILLRIKSFLHPVAYEVKETDSPITAFIYSYLDTPIVQSVIALLLVYAHAVVLNILVNNNRLNKLPTALAGMVYILLVSSIKEFQMLSPALIGMTFILIACYNIFNTYKKTQAATNIFNATLATSLASLIYPPYLFTIFAFFIGLATLRNFNYKERIQFLLGSLALYWIVGAFMYFLGQLDWSFFNSIQIPGALSDISFTDTRVYWTLGIGLVLVLFALFNYYQYMKKKGIEIRKKIDFFYWLLLSSFLSLFFFIGLDVYQYIFICFSIAIFLSMTLDQIRKTALAEVIHLCLLMLVFYLHFAL